MKFSRNWLQSYIKETLPSDEAIENILNKKAFEVEGIEIAKGSTEHQLSGDTVYDIKVLPNRHGDALSHYFMAKELCTLLYLSLLKIDEGNLENVKRERAEETKNKHSLIKIKIENEKDCPVFEAVHIDGLDTRPSPDWLRSRLEAIGQRSINAIVDITNYVQFAINKPMHAYDARDIDGGFIIRRAHKGEKLIALDGVELDIDTDTLVIADNDKALGLAGIKGGIYSSIKPDTIAIILESANFDPILIRQTAKKYNMRTDASKRFEAGQSNVLVRMGTDLAIYLYKQVFGADIKVGAIYRDGKGLSEIGNEQIKIITTLKNINETLGASYADDQIQKTIKSYDWTFTSNRQMDTLYTVCVPLERVDLKIEVDLIEELGRALGYDTLVSILPKITDENGKARYGKYNSQMYLEMALRNALSVRAYNEVMTYTLTDKGQIHLDNSVGMKSLRDNISDGLLKSFHQNLNHIPLMQIEVIRIYEVGSVFEDANDKNSNIKEYRSLAIICDDNKKKSNFENEIKELINGIEKELFSGIDENIKINFVVKSNKPYTIEINLNVLLEQQIKYTKLEENKNGGMVGMGIDHKKVWKYKHLSPYPVVVRDVSCFYEDNLSIESLLALIKNEIKSEQENLVKEYYLVDSFEKKLEDGTIKRSAAFRIVYQSDDRTLTDEEVNMEVYKIYKALQNAGCELR